jgi:hypothetical protein
VNTELFRPLNPKPTTTLLPSSDWMEDCLGNLTLSVALFCQDSMRSWGFVPKGTLTKVKACISTPVEKPYFWINSPMSNRTVGLPPGLRLTQPVGILGQKAESIRFNSGILLEKWRRFPLFPPFHESEHLESGIKLFSRHLASGLDHRQKVILSWNGLTSNIWKVILFPCLINI